MLEYTAGAWEETDFGCGLGRQSGGCAVRWILVKVELRRSCSRAAYLSRLSSRERFKLKPIPERVREISSDFSSMRKMLAIVSVDSRGNFRRKSFCCQRCCRIKETSGRGVGVE